MPDYYIKGTDMAAVFGTTTRGCFIRMQTNTAAGKGATLTGAFTLELTGSQKSATVSDPFNRRAPDANDFSNSAAATKGNASGADPLVVVGFSFKFNEIYSIVKCFGEKFYIYSFGNDLEQSIMSVTITGFLNGDIVGQVVRKYANSRLTNVISADVKNKLAVLTIGSASLSGYVVGIQSSTESNEYNLQTINVNILINA